MKFIKKPHIIIQNILKLVRTCSKPIHLLNFTLRNKYSVCVFPMQGLLQDLIQPFGELCLVSTISR